MNIVKDVDLIDDIDKYDVILVGTNAYHIMGNGFQRKVRVNYPLTYKANLNTKYADRGKVGDIVSVEVNDITFVLCFITFGINYDQTKGDDYLDYEALEKCLNEVKNKYSDKKIATTMIGCSRFDGNGDKDRVLKVIDNIMGNNVNITIYDYEQLNIHHEKAIEYRKLKENESLTPEEKYDILMERKREDEEGYRFGNFRSRTLDMKEELLAVINKRKKELEQEENNKKK